MTGKKNVLERGKSYFPARSTGKSAFARVKGVYARANIYFSLVPRPVYVINMYAARYGGI